MTTRVRAAPMYNRIRQMDFGIDIARLALALNDRSGTPQNPFANMACSSSLVPLASFACWRGPEHGRTIPLADIG
jgi:hypothetical protein